MTKEFTKEDMVDFIKHYDNKKESDCFDTYEEELAEYMQIRKVKKLGLFSVMLRFSSEQVELNKKAIESAIAICDWDNYDKDKYKSPKEQINDMHWLIKNLNGA